ncbi:MAG: hypothetical protein HGA27_00375 [Peptococcaceae bacterium]|nr:hypothetical protein [Peptococcaceae bacterium]
MDAVARLDEYLEQDTENSSTFRIENTEMAVWALRKVCKIENSRNESRSAAQTEIDRIKTWLADEEERADQNRGYFEMLLEDYHRRILLEDPRAKTIKLPHGELQMRAQQPEFTKDDEVLLAWAKENHPEFIIVPPTPEPKLDWPGLKKTAHILNEQIVDPATGEIIPGISVVERPAKFTIKLKED